jgi:hypothetical protein
VSPAGSSRRALGCLLGATIIAALAPRAEAKVFHAKSEALQLAFPDAERVETEIFYPTDEQVKQVEELARTPLDSKLITFHVGKKGEQTLGYAFIETHIVRTLPETFLIVVSPAGVVDKLFVLAFYEPQEYLPSERWLAQFPGKSLSPELSLRGDIHGIAGATLTSRAVTSGVRKVLALFDVLVRGKS